MEGFLHSDAGKGMLNKFKKIFKGAMDVNVVPFDEVIDADKTLVIDGVIYQFAQTKMPGSDLTINLRRPGAFFRRDSGYLPRCRSRLGIYPSERSMETE